MHKLSIAVGLLLLITASGLSYFAMHNGEKMLIKKDALVMKYVNASDSALENENVQDAIKYAKLAIQADPKSKKGYVCYSNALNVDNGVQDNNSEDTPQASDNSDDSMGC